ncbi:MAG: phytanoyl-CoA dioxygenase family protein, partial [Candidatus Poribacteria bacterium]|nr:phytanoyl-CoA dioxygenase family protein [Candidatus Poribacteria bacterium]
MAFYEQNGYLLAKGVFTREEAALFREETHALAHRLLSVSDPSVRS